MDLWCSDRLPYSGRGDGDKNYKFLDTKWGQAAEVQAWGFLTYAVDMVCKQK